MNRDVFLLTAGGLGLLRPAPGTWGSTPPPALALLLATGLSAGGLATGELVLVNAAVIALGAVFAVACARLGHRAEAHFGKKDPGAVVADEVAGQSIALLGLPWAGALSSGAFSWDAARHDVLLAAGAFLAFRFFDILKPPPIRRLERIGGGVGILVDDLLAGVYALVLVQVVVRFVI